MIDKRDDVTSDPGLDEDESRDWAAEGGGLPQGPATDTRADDTEEEPPGEDGKLDS